MIVDIVRYKYIQATEKGLNEFYIEFESELTEKELAKLEWLGYNIEKVDYTEYRFTWN